MMTDELDDVTLRRLGRLQVLEPDPVRGERVRARSRALMARRHERVERVTRPDPFTSLMLQPAVVIVLCISYLFAVAYDVLRLPHH
jgi:hypothetical protein